MLQKCRQIYSVFDGWLSRFITWWNCACPDGRVKNISSQGQETILLRHLDIVLIYPPPLLVISFVLKVGKVLGTEICDLTAQGLQPLSRCSRTYPWIGFYTSSSSHLTNINESRIQGRLLWRMPVKVRWSEQPVIKYALSWACSSYTYVCMNY